MAREVRGGDERSFEHERRQVRIREVAVVVRGLLDPHPVRLAALLRPAASLLGQGLAGVQGDRLAVDLEVDRPLDGPEVLIARIIAQQPRQSFVIKSQTIDECASLG